MADDSHTTFRVCSKCGAEKPATDAYFQVYKSTSGKFLLRQTCRLCRGAKTEGREPYKKGLTPEEKRERNRARCRDYFARNKEKILEGFRLDRAANPEKHREWDRRNYEKNKGAGSEYQKRRYALKDKAKALEDNKRWKAENPDKVRAHWERTYEKHKGKHRDRVKRWTRMKRRTDPEFREKAYAKNREWRAANKEWERQHARKKRARLKDDPAFKIMASVRARVRSALKGLNKSQSTSELIGAPLDVVKAYIEAQFCNGMTWGNWGRGWGGAREWHLDHVRPLASFDLTDPVQLAQACHYKNLQPLWAVDNLKKGHAYERSYHRQLEGGPRA